MGVPSVPVGSCGAPREHAESPVGAQPKTQQYQSQKTAVPGNLMFEIRKMPHIGQIKSSSANIVLICMTY